MPRLKDLYIATTKKVTHKFIEAIKLMPCIEYLYNEVDAPVAPIIEAQLLLGLVEPCLSNERSSEMQHMNLHRFASISNQKFLKLLVSEPDPSEWNFFRSNNKYDPPYF